MVWSACDFPPPPTDADLRNFCREGKIKYIGLSAISSATLRRAIKVAHVDAVQSDYSVAYRDVEGPAGTDLLATCKELGVAFVAAMPLNRGLMTATFASGAPLGDATDMRPAVMPRFQEANRAKNEVFVRQFQALADKLGCTTSQLALAWLLKQGDMIFPIPGTKHIKYL